MADASQTPALPAELPVVPLRGAVVLPLTVAPLGVNRPMSVEAINRSLAGDRMVLLLLQQNDTDEPAADDLHRVGTIAIVRQMAKGAGGMRVLVEGVLRARAEFLQTDRGFVRALIKPMAESAERAIEVDARVRRLQELVDRALSLTTGLSPDIKSLVMGIDDPLRIVYLLASLLDMKAEDKQKLLEENDLSVKLDAVSVALSREIEVLELKGQIESRAEKEMTDAQRQYVLRQQLKAIQSELGEGESEATELRKRVTEAALPETVETVAMREVDRLERMTPASPEYQMIRTYLDWVLDVPWHKPTEDRLDPIEARRVLDEDHYDLDKVKERIVEYLAVQKLRHRRSGEPGVPAEPGRGAGAPGVTMKGPILCFVGPPGVGKTSLGQSIARAMTRKFMRISLGGVRDEAEIRGHRRTYIGSMPGRIVQALKTAGSSNPVLMLDEIDKISVGIQGDPAAALLEVLDPAQNHAFRDHYLEIPLDLSHVLFITTANQLGTVHPALLDRMEMIALSGYTEEEKVHIARMYLVPRQRDEHGLKPEQIEITDGALGRVISEYTREAGVRTLERQIGTIARKVAARVATDSNYTATVDADRLGDYLGPPRFRSEAAFRTSKPGVATGVAWTESGGDVLFIEAVLLPGGSGHLTLTGQLGSVMQESARAALSHVRQQSAALGIPVEALSKHDIHVHVPAGAIPKDGPSAGVTMASAIVSAARGEPVRSEVAMTGEITLSGLVLPVGGIREKALAARRHGIKTFVLPQMNEQDLAELPEEVRREMTFVPARTLEDVLKVALPGVASAESAGISADTGDGDAAAALPAGPRAH
ncbi:MAG: endopeptidase La [Acidobacteria bacterium RIFCSPLOWO2_12_FULL_66_21]|nr:MAG: endopeptidase La [Acidobacteria bacterium RIFCSPLOWO2_12_FULL_66_21]